MSGLDDMLRPVGALRRRTTVLEGLLGGLRGGSGHGGKAVARSRRSWTRSRPDGKLPPDEDLDAAFDKLAKAGAK